MKIRDFNRGWEFHSDKSAEAQIVNLPHDAMLMENRDKSNPSGGACPISVEENIHIRRNSTMMKKIRM